MQKLNRNNQSKHYGFTLVELLVVIVVLAILVAISMVMYNGIQDRAREATVSSEVKNAGRALAAYQVEHDELPEEPEDAGIQDSEKVQFEYTKRDDSTYCITGTSQKTSMSMSDGTLIKGACPGHDSGGIAAIINHVPNPGFEVNRDGWGWINGGYTGNVTSTMKHTGESSFAITAPNDTARDRYLEAIISPGVAGTYRISAYAYLTSAGETFKDRDTMLAISNGFGTNAGPDVKYDRTRLNQWQHLTRVVTTTTDATRLRARFYAPLGGTIYIDSVMVTPGDEIRPYHDGDSPNWIWLGAPHSSASKGVST